MKKTIFKQFMFATSIIMLFLLATTSCNEPSIISADVIDTDRPDVVFTDTLTIFTSSIKDDSIRIYDAFNVLSSHLCGVLDDPIFGRSTSEINAQLRVAASITDTITTALMNISPSGTQLDSVVFVLEYDESRIFGNDNTQQDVSIYLLDESMDNLETYYSTDNFSAGDLLVTKYDVNPSQFDTITIIGTDTLDAPSLRLVLSDSELMNSPIFSDILFKDSTSLPYYRSDDTLLQILNGVKVLVEDNTDPKDLMMSFKLSSSGFSGMFLHFRTLTHDLVYRFRFTSNAAQMTSFEHDYTGSTAAPFIDGVDDETDGEEYIFVQGMQGLNGKLRIPYTNGLKNSIINQAQLELTIATMVPDDVPALSTNPLDQIFLSKKNEDGDLVIISDLNTASIIGNLGGIFGGSLIEKTENNMVIQTYTMNISEHLQDMINGIEPSDELFITTASKAQSANRSIIFGTGHPTYAPKLNVTYTINQ